MIRVRGAQVEVGEVIEEGEVYCVVDEFDHVGWSIAVWEFAISDESARYFRDATPSVPAPAIDAVVGEREQVIESNELANVIQTAAEKWIPFDVLYAVVEAVKANGWSRAVSPIDDVDWEAQHARLECHTQDVEAALREARAEMTKWHSTTLEREAAKNAAEGRARIAERERDEARAVVAAERERIAAAIEADCVAVTAEPGTGERGWQLGHNKGLSDAARIARSES